MWETNEGKVGAWQEKSPKIKTPLLGMLRIQTLSFEMH